MCWMFLRNIVLSHARVVVSKFLVFSCACCARELLCAGCADGGGDSEAGQCPRVRVHVRVCDASFRTGGCFCVCV